MGGHSVRKEWLATEAPSNGNLESPSTILESTFRMPLQCSCVKRSGPAQGAYALLCFTLCWKYHYINNVRPRPLQAQLGSYSGPVWNQMYTDLHYGYFLV